MHLLLLLSATAAAAAGAAAVLTHSFHTDRCSLRSMHSITLSRSLASKSKVKRDTKSSGFVRVRLSVSLSTGRAFKASTSCVCVRASVCVTNEIKFIYVYKKKYYLNIVVVVKGKASPKETT